MINSIPDTIQKNPLLTDTTAVDSHTLELLAEKPEVTLERVVTGNVKLSKKVNTQTINVPVTLTQEVLIIEYDENALPKAGSTDKLVSIDNGTAPTASVLVNGQVVTLTDKPLEVVISQQVARVAINTLVAETVKVNTTQQQHEQTIPVTLRHEELVTETIKLDNPKILSSEVVDIEAKPIDRR